MLALTPAASSRPGASKPVLGRTVVVVPVAGKVFVKPEAAGRFSLLEARRLIAVGSTVDTSRGTVKLVTATTTPGETQFGLFDGGAFEVTQDRSGLADLRLVGGRRRSQVCGGRSRRGPIARISARYLRTLHGRVGATAGATRGRHGRFRTRGSYAAATVRGTEWTTTDRCEGTHIVDHAGQVATQARSSSLTFPLKPGQTVEYRCSPNGQPPVSTAYCVAILTDDTTLLVNGHRERFFIYTTGLSTKSPDEQNDQCVTGPQRTECTTFPLAPPDQFGFRTSITGCMPDQGAGDYSVSWRLRGVVLGAPLSFHSPIADPFVNPCLAWLGKTTLGGSLGSLPANFKNVNRYSLPTGALVWELRIFLFPNRATGQQVLRGIVYADSNGEPGALVGATNELTFHSTQSPGWYDLAFPTLLRLPAGNYWIGVIMGPGDRVAGVTYDTVAGSRAYNANAYSSGPSDPFGPIGVGNEQISFYLAYYVKQA